MNELHSVDAMAGYGRAGQSARALRRGLLAFVVGCVLAASADAETLDIGLSLVPADAEAVFVVPNLKRASDDLQACLERAERAEANLLGRPLDVLKALLGVPVGVRDDGALVGVVRWPEGAEEPLLTLIVPVTDSERFLADNFEAGAVADAGGRRTVRRKDGTTLHVSQLEEGSRRWVALSPAVEGLAGLGVDHRRSKAIREELGAAGGAPADSMDVGPGDRLLRGSEVVALVRGAGLRRVLEQGAAARAAAMEAVAGVEAAASVRAAGAQGAALLEAVRVVAMAWDIDPLGLIGRGLVVIDQGHPLGRSLQGGARSTAEAKGGRLGLLPGQPAYLALGVDLGGLGGVSAFTALAELVGISGERLSWLGGSLAGVEEFQVAIYPSKLGVAVGGVLNDAALVVRSSAPAALRDQMRAGLEELQGERGGFRRSLIWQSDREVKDSGTADAFELEQSALPGDAGPDLVTSLVTSVVLGSRGFHGFLKPMTPQRLLVATFSQRPDVWRRAVSAASGEGTLLGTGGAVAAMRRFALPDPDVELVVGISQLLRLAQQVARMVPGADGAVPSLDAGSEPIYAGLEVHEGRIEGACVIPAGVVGLLIDRAKQMQRRP